jgi:hypothetical protein
VPIYRRFQERGRLAPEGLQYVASWVTTDLACCYQVMECADHDLLEAWMAQWRARFSSGRSTRDPSDL